MFKQPEEKSPPTAELMHYQIKESLPSFVVVRNAATLFVTPEDYFFTYDDAMYCHGGYYGDIPYARAFGTDKTTTTKEGFALGEKINLGFYDASEDKYFNLITDQALTYKSLGLYYVVAVKGQEIELNIHSALLNTEIEVLHLPESFDVYKDENLFFKVNTEGLVDVGISLYKGQGYLQVVDRWVNGHSVNVQYTGAPTETDVNFHIDGKALFTGETVAKDISVGVTNSKPNIPDPEEPVQTEIYKTDKFRLYLSEFKSFGTFIFVESLLDVPVWLSLIFEKESGSRISSTLRSDVNGGRGISVDNITSIEVFRMWIDRVSTEVERVKINL